MVRRRRTNEGINMSDNYIGNKYLNVLADMGIVCTPVTPATENHFDLKYYLQLTVDGTDLAENICPHFKSARDAVKWVMGHPGLTTVITQ